MNLLWQKWRGYLAIGMVVAMLAFCVTGCGTKEKVDYAAMEGEEAVIEYDNVSMLRILTEQSFALMTEQYIVASLMTEKASRFDTEKMPPSAFFVELERVRSEWDSFEELKKRTQLMADTLAKLEKDSDKKKVAWNIIPLSRAYAAEPVKWRQMVNKSYEDFSMGQQIADLTPQIGRPDMEEKAKGFYSAYTKQEQASMTEADKKALAQEAENAKKNIKVAAVGTGILMIPVGMTTGLLGVGAALEAGGVLAATQAGVGFVATMTGALGTAMGVGEDASGKELQGTGKAIKNTVNFISVTAGGANLLLGVTGSGFKAAENLAKSGKPVTMKELVKMTAKDFWDNQSVTERVLLCNDAKSAAELAAELKAQGMDYFVGTTEDGTPCVTIKRKAEEQPQAVNIDELSDEQLVTEINTQWERIRELQKQTDSMSESDKDWVFKKLYGMTKEEFDKKRWAYAEDARFAVETDKMGLYLDIYQMGEQFTKPYETYIKSDEYKQEVERREKAQLDKNAEIQKILSEVLEMEEEKKLRVMEKMEAQKQAEKEKEKEISGKVSGKVSEEPPYAVSKIIGATGAYTKENVYHHDDIEPGLKDVVRYNYNWQVVASGESFVIQEDSEIFNVAAREETYRSSQRNYTVKSYDPQTGTGVVVNDKGKSYSFSISGKPGDMHIVIENR